MSTSSLSPAVLAVQPVILCGGSGTRLWPLSRAGFPKQFLCLTGDDSGGPAKSDGRLSEALQQWAVSPEAIVARIQAMLVR